MANQCPAHEVFEDGVLVVVKDRDVDIPVIARLPAEPSIGSPSTAEEPWRAETEEQVAHVRDGLRHWRRRLIGSAINHHVNLAPRPRQAQPIYADARSACLARRSGAYRPRTAMPPAGFPPCRWPGEASGTANSDRRAGVHDRGRHAEAFRLLVLLACFNSLRWES